MEAFEEFSSSCNFMSLENDKISKQSAVHLPMSTYETPFLYDKLPTSLTNVPTSVSNDSNSLLASTSKAIMTINIPNSQILVVNSVACQLLNYSSDELCSMRLDNLISGPYKHKVSKLFDNFLKYAHEISCNEKLLEFVKKDNETISGLIYLKRIINPGRCLAIIEPIERKLGWMMVDKSKNVLSCDESISSAFQYDPSEILGLNIYTLLPNIDFSQRNDNQWNDISRQHVTGRTKSGEAFPVSLVVSAGNSNNTDKYKIWLWIYINLNGFILLNKKLLITSCSSHVFKILLGFSKQEVLNQPIFHLIPAFCKSIQLEKNPKECYHSSMIKNTNFCWNDNNESFDDWDESFLAGECISPKRSEGSAPFGNFTFSSKLCEESSSGLRVDFDEDYGVKTLFRHERAKNEEPRSACSFSSYPSRDYFEDKITFNTAINKFAQNEFEPMNNLFDYYSPKNQNILVQEGKFSGFAKHYDGSCIAVKYQVKVLAVKDECVYCVWLSNDFYKYADVKKRFNTSIIFSGNSTSIDGSVHKNSDCSGQYTRPSTASLISQCDEALTAGDYSQHYTNIRQIGKGAFGYVKMAFRNCDGLLVVTKFIKKQKINVRSWVFHSNLNMKIPLEISLLTTLQHPNIVKVLDVFHNDSFVQLVMEKHGAGFDLFEFINRGPNCDEKLKSYIFRQIISAVYYLNSLGILHRDIKDENVIINEKFEIKLIDFGSATFIPPNETFSKFYGTVEYCSPEVLQGNNYKGPELEIWALGVTLYVLTFGDNPFHNIEETIRGQFSIPFPISKELDLLLNQMLDKNIESRITIDRVVEDPWINQPVSIENYRFEEVVQCSDEEAYPPKYVHEIKSEEFYGRDSSADSNLLEERNNSYGSVQNLTGIDGLDVSDFPQDRKCYESENSESKMNIPSFIVSSTPVRWRKDRLSKSVSGVTENFKTFFSLRDCGCESRNACSVERETRLRNGYLKHFRSSSSSETDGNGVKEKIVLSGFNNYWESDLEFYKSHK